MAGATTVLQLPYPTATDANNVPADILAVVTALDAGSYNKRLSQAQIGALPAGQKPAGTVVYNQTTLTLQVSDGVNFADLVSSSGINRSVFLLMGA